MELQKWLDNNKKIFTNLSDKIYDFAELKFDEINSANAIKAVLKENDFEITEKIGQIDTAFIGSYGQGKPVIGILAEFDALDGLSQVNDIAEKIKQPGMNTGHGCGHHLLGAGAVAAAVALKNYLKDNNKNGTIRLYGCPGEEGGSGKAFMAKEKVFDDLDSAITWHPSSTNAIIPVSTLANIQVYFRFKGRSAHAAASPHLGRSALDSVELMNVGVNYLREHIISDARVHYAITNSGGTSPNVVQAEAEVIYLIRAPKISQVMSIYERVCNIARGAALMSETTVEIEVDKACSNIIPNDTLGITMANITKQIPSLNFTEEEMEYANKFISTFSDDIKNNNATKMFLSKLDRNIANQLASELEKPLFSPMMPYFKIDTVMPGSSDVGDVSWITPTVQCGTTCYAQSTPEHSWQMVAQGKSSIAHKGMIYAAKIMAETAKYLFENTNVIEQAKLELKEKIGNDKYVCPIIDGMTPRKFKVAK